MSNIACPGCGGITHCSCSHVVGTALAAVRARDAEITRLRARVAELSDLVGYLAGRNNDHIRVMLAGNPDVCDRLIDRARAALEDKP
jgi:t-SNARE complex subunit (syntaxin)